MGKNLVVFVAVMCLLVIAAPNLFAENETVAISAKAGTLGVGLEGIVGITQHFNARIGANTFSFSYEGTESDIKYDTKLKLLTFAGLVDWFPFSNGFRISAGAMINKNKFELNATASGTYDIGGTTYTAAEVGTLSGKIDFKNLAPYAGIGFGNPFGKDSNWSFNFDIGVMFQGSPDLSVSTTGTLSANAAFQADLEREKRDLEDNLNKAKYYPVIAIGISYRF